MKLSRYLFLLSGILFLSQCGKQDSIKETKKYFDIPAFFQNEIKIRSSENLGLEKITSKGEDINSEIIDTVNWEKELEPFSELNMNKPAFENKFQKTVDSSTKLCIIRYQALDSTLEMQEVVIWKNPAGKIINLEIVTKLRSWVVDRDVRYNYQPAGGYGISVKENYIWQKPGQFDIFAQVKNPKLLYR